MVHQRISHASFCGSKIKGGKTVKRIEYKTVYIKPSRKPEKVNEQIILNCEGGWEFVSIAVADMLGDWVNTYVCVFKRESNS